MGERPARRQRWESLAARVGVVSGNAFAGAGGQNVSLARRREIQSTLALAAFCGMLEQ
jgi:hypothetical protein